MKENFEQMSSAPVGTTPNSLLTELQDMRASRSPVSPNAINNIQDLKSFGAGMSAGIIDAGQDFIEFLATPNSVSNALAGIGPVLDTAVNYYGDKLTNNRAGEIATDAATMRNFVGRELEAYSRLTPNKRGKIVGDLAADMFVIEAGVGISRAMVPGAEASATAGKATSAFEGKAGKAAGCAGGAGYAGGAESSAKDVALLLEGDGGKFDRYLASLNRADRVHYKRIAKLGSSPEFAELVDNIAERLPESLQRGMYAKGVELIPVRSIAEIEPRLSDSTLGLYTVRDGQRYIFISEKGHLQASHSGDPVRTIELTMRHELAHAMDHLKGSQWASMQSPLFDAFNADFRALNAEAQQFIIATFGRGSLDTTRKEIVAEIVSHQAVPDACPTLRALVLRNFPRLAKTIDKTGQNSQ